MSDLDILRPMLELSVVVPAAVLCFLPMKGHLRGMGKKAALFGIPALLLWAAAGGAVCFYNRWDGNICLFPSLIGFALIFRHMVALPAWKSVSVLLAVCGVLSSITNLAIIADALFAPGNTAPWFTLKGGAVYILLAWILLGVLWYPATHCARWLLNEMEMPGTWYVFWIVPAVFIGVNLMLLFYLMFYLMARGLGKTMRLHRENEFLQMQASQYRILQKNMEDTRRARHDLRQHFMALQGCIESGSLEAVADYVQSYGEKLPPDTVRTYCKNYAVNALLRYYGEKAMQDEIDMEVSVRMEEHTVIPEPEFCVLLGNLLENALDACAVSNGPHFVRVNIRQTGSSMLSLTVDNTSAQPPVWEKGKLRSSRRDDFGMGTESARIIAERYNGDVRFEWKDNIFYASVMLNP
ncbi:hypothetical protein PMF13cell1_02887 [Blautia producta]|uniref:Sensor histidine kinase NatK-like C-terminal domain-containing protein n=1 Tax=Blautia producta TaxID=33035 RepID=A0A4P6LXK2_9FIRM|nr:ATP-binding protein [Blautia producta]QBE97331.1 hypothetical protein PMF13cell1_02887 [Blautia producta]